MTEQVLITVIVVGAAFTAILLTVTMAAIFAGAPSSFESWLAVRKEVKLAEIELKKIEAEHLRKCPRLTDSPRD